MNLEKFLNSVVGSREGEFRPSERELTQEEIADFEKSNKLYRTDKLYDARDFSGERSHELSEVIREAENKFSEFSSFIGIAPYGSRTKGYSTEGSDFDLLVLMDPEEKDTPDLLSALDSFTVEKQKEGKKISFQQERMYPEYLEEGIPELGLRVYEPGEFFQGYYRYYTWFNLVTLSHIVTGDRKQKYRENVRGQMAKLDDVSRGNVLQNLVNFLIYIDEHSIPKMEARAKEAGEDDHFDQEEWLSSRRKLWEERVYTLFGK